MRDQIGRKVNSTMRAFPQHVRQFIPFAQDARYLSSYIDELTVDICLVAWIGCAGGLLRGSGRWTVLCDVAKGHLVRRVRTLPLRYEVVVLVNLHLLHILYARVNGIVLFLTVCGRSDILNLGATTALKITTLIIEMLEHLDDKILRIIISIKILIL